MQADSNHVITYVTACDAVSVPTTPATIDDDDSVAPHRADAQIEDRVR